MKFHNVDIEGYLKLKQYDDTLPTYNPTTDVKRLVYLNDTIGGADSIYIGGVQTGDWFRMTGTEDTPVEGNTSIGISSNWAYDHVNTFNAHNDIIDTPINGMVVKAISSNWAWDHQEDSAEFVHGASVGLVINSIAMRDGAGKLNAVSGTSGSELIAFSTFYVHTSTTTSIHGSTSVATINTIIQRDASGRAKVADPFVDADIATKKYVDDEVSAVALGSFNPTAWSSVTGSQVDTQLSATNPYAVYLTATSSTDYNQTVYMGPSLGSMVLIHYSRGLNNSSEADSYFCIIPTGWYIRWSGFGQGRKMALN